MAARSGLIPLPQRSRSKTTRVSKTASQGERTKTQKDSTANSTPRVTRPGAGVRTASAPLVPSTTDPHLIVAEGLDVFAHRGSVVSIKDDPFFRNYQTPNSVSLAREMRTATYSEHSDDEGALHISPPPRSPKRPAADSVNLAVCFPIQAGGLG